MPSATRSGHCALNVLRRAVLLHMRVPPSAVLISASRLSAPATALFGRPFSEASGTYLDRAVVTERVLTILKNFQKVDPAKVTPSSNFQKDLGLDSLDTVEVVMAFEEEFAVEIPDSEADKIVSASDAIEYISSHPKAK
eukprot:TRINITY_DN75_c0_g1_i1.p1 TRINITY_DN75_c0_g1~~TRINITY_DN75_c0_g1_i1.p1  ORF type:complete len:139 (-),score=28.70 TRINITY_DN75_c0_g1_i1:328-744(-)